MKSKISFLFVFLIAICLSLNTHAQTRLKIGTDNWPPYEFYEGGKKSNPVTGFSTEVLVAILHQMKVDFDKIKIYPWARGEIWVFKGKIDVLYSASPSEKRHKYCYRPDEPLIESPWVLFIRKEDEERLKFDSFKDLIGKSVGVVRDYSYTPEFWSFLKDKGKYQVVNGDEQNFKKLMKKRMDYVISEFGNGIAIVKKLGIYNQVVPLKNNPIKVTGLYVLFSKKTVSKKLVDEFSRQLREFKSTQEYRKIYSKYF